MDLLCRRIRALGGMGSLRTWQRRGGESLEWRRGVECFYSCDLRRLLIGQNGMYGCGVKEIRFGRISED